MIEKNFEIAFVADLALREKQIQQNYRPVIAVHKWFARRPGTLFRALLLSEFGSGSLRQSFFKCADLSGFRVADPFMGGGTPLLEANRMGCDVLGFDINPMAYWIVREEMEHLDLIAYRKAANMLLAELTETIGSFYTTRCMQCDAPHAPVKYFLWVKMQSCHACGNDIDLSPGYLLAENRRHPQYVYICDQCGALTITLERQNPWTIVTCKA